MNTRNTARSFIAAFVCVLITALLAVSLFLPSSASAATPLQGDLNGDGRIDCQDLILLQMCLNNPQSSCDIDGNTITNTADRTLLINIILGKKKPTGGGGGNGGSGTTPTLQSAVYFNNSSYAKTYGPGVAGQNFTARVQIDNVNYLYNGSFNVSYNASLLQINNVGNGNFSGKDIPMVNGTDWTNSAGLLTVMPNLSAYINMSSNTSAGISGSGYLCDIQFQTIGAGNSALVINGTLNQRKNGNFSAISGTKWTNSSVVITQWYNLSISSAAHGNVTAPGTGNFSYANNTSVTITANTTDSCWQFYRWEGDTGAITNVSAASTTIRMNGSYTVTANFSIKTFTLNVTANNSGGSPSFDGTSPFNCGAVANISANTNACSTFAGWTPTAGVTDPNAENTTVLMNATRNLTARYIVKRVTLTTGSSDGGNVTVPAVEGAHIYNCSQVVTITATPDNCRSFVNWSGTGVTAGKVADNYSATTTITMDDNYSVYATFMVSSTPTLTLYADPVEGGTQTGNGTYDCGNNSPIQANPNFCYTFVNWTPTDGVASPTSASTTVSMTTDRTLTAHYAIRTFTLSVNASPTAGGSPTGAGTYNCSSNATISANNNSCYNFVNWMSTGKITIANPSATTTNVTVNGNGTVTANYSIKQFALTTNVSPAEAVTAGCTVDGAGTYGCGANATVQANSAGRYIFDSWSGTGVENASAAATNVSMTQARDVTANFVQIPMVYFETVGTQKVGTPFNIKVMIDNVSYMSYAAFDIRFNSSILSYQSTNTTSIIGDGTGTVTKGPAGDSELLRIVVAYSDYAATNYVNGHPNNGVNGSGILCTLNFSPIAEGTSPLNFVDGQGTPIGELTLLSRDNSSGIYTIENVTEDVVIDPVYWQNSSINVSTKTLVSIAVTPASASINTSDTLQFAANGSYDDSSYEIITSSVTWASSNTSVATIASGGLATGVAAGTANISASLSGITSNNATLTVTQPALVSIAVTPTSASINTTETQQFIATGTYTSGPTQNITAYVTWASSNTSVATIASGGLATGVAAGTANISASLSGITSNNATLTVNAAPTLVSIAVTPASASINTTETQQFIATGTYTSGPTQNITASVTWTSSNTSVATIASGGLATGVAAGTTNISASLSGITSNNATLTVNAAAITYNLTITASSGGTVVDPGIGTYTYNAGDVVNINASQNFCNRFVNWSGDTGNISNAGAQFTNITMNGNYTIQANFETITYNLTTANTTGGTVASPGIGTYIRNCSQNVTIVATNYSCYRFLNWSGSTGQIADPNASTTNITMFGDYSITANFAPITYSLTVNDDGNGSTTPSGTSTRACNEVVAIVATNDSGYTFVNWSGDTNSIDNANAASANITMNGTKTIQANFAPEGGGAPTVTSISLSKGATIGGNTVTITGTNFVSGATVTIGANASTSVTFVNSTTLTAIAPLGTAGAANVVVTNPDTQSGTLTSGYTYVVLNYVCYTTYTGQSDTYWKYTWTLRETLASGTGDNQTYGGLSDKYDVRIYSDATCTAQVYPTRGSFALSTCWSYTLWSLPVNAQYDWRGASDYQMRKRYNMARSSGMNVTNFVFERSYSPTGTFGAPYTLGEGWTFTEQTNSTQSSGDNTSVYSASIAAATESITVSAGTFTCYNVTFINTYNTSRRINEYWDTSGIFPYAPIKIVDKSSFCQTQTSQLSSSSVYP